MGKKKTVSVSIVIIFNQLRKDKLFRLLDTLKPQLNDYSCEILLVHESSERLNTKAMNLPVKCRYITIPEKLGFSFNRNQGIKHARGEIIVFIDDDCWVREKWLKSLIDPLLEKRPRGKEILVTTSGTKIPKSNLLGDCISALGFPGGGSLGFEKVWKVSKEGFTNHLAVGNCAIKKNAFDIVGKFDESMILGAEDAELSFRLEKKGIPIKYVPEAYAFHEARTTLTSFVSWQLRRGGANYQFKQKVGPVGRFIKLRIWSAKNIMEKNILEWKLPLITTIIGLSFLLQQLGYLKEMIQNE
jgi:GT2 family glycosyltransferase